MVIAHAVDLVIALVVSAGYKSHSVELQPHYIRLLGFRVGVLYSSSPVGAVVLGSDGAYVSADIKAVTAGDAFAGKKLCGSFHGVALCRCSEVEGHLRVAEVNSSGSPVDYQIVDAAVLRSADQILHRRKFSGFRVVYALFAVLVPD